MIDDLLRPTSPGPRPPADGFLLALRDARRRRWRKIRNGAACATAATGAVLAAVVPRLALTSVSGLEPTRPVIATHGAASPAPSPSPSSSPPAATPRPQPNDVPFGYAAGPRGRAVAAGYGPGGYPPAPGAGAAPGPAPTAGPVAPPPTAEPDGGAPDPTDPPPTVDPPPPSPAPTPSPSPTPSQEPIDQSMADQSATAPCNGSTWCLSAEVTGPANGTRTLRLLACRAASDTSGILRFTRENEADFRVLRDGVEVWRWSVGQPDEDYVHEVWVDRWMCAVWSTPWSRTDNSGARVGAGTYRLDATSRATNLPSQWWSASFSVT